MRRFPIRRSRWALPFLLPLSLGRPYAEVGEGEVRVRMGLIGRADVPVGRIASIGTMTWPWWGGVGARIARGMVAFLGASGAVVVLDLTEQVKVRAPLSWRARSIGVGVEDVSGFITAVVAEREAAEASGTPEPSGT
ncbi:MAG TPA: hypothetical protein VFV33_01045 [Gemmatimonadaceae bacterium]|nr:hypothetical protein [Gemmatimonadaceae bacterium]